MSQMNLHTYGGGIHTFIFELVFFSGYEQDRLLIQLAVWVMVPVVPSNIQWLDRFFASTGRASGKQLFEPLVALGSLSIFSE